MLLAYINFLSLKTINTIDNNLLDVCVHFNNNSFHISHLILTHRISFFLFLPLNCPCVYIIIYLTASEPNLKVRSALKAKLSEHRCSPLLKRKLAKSRLRQPPSSSCGSSSLVQQHSYCGSISESSTSASASTFSSSMHAIIHTYFDIIRKLFNSSTLHIHWPFH